MAENNTLQFTIKAVDEATKQLDAVKKSLGDMSATADDTNKHLKDFNDAQGKAGKGTESMATSVFKGGLALEALKKGTEIAIDFTKESVKAYLEAEEKMNLVRATVVSTGQSYEKVGVQIDAFAQKMARMGVDDEDASMAMAKLGKIAGGDFTKGMELAKLASDLTASGFGTLESNTDNLAKIMTGKGQRALMEYKIQLDANATTAEMLRAVQQKVTMSTEQYAETTNGKIATVKVAFDNLKESVGEGFVSAVASAIDSGGQFGDVLDGIDGTAKILKVAVFELVQGIIFLGQSAKETGQVLVDSFNVAKKVVSFDFKGALAEAGKGADHLSTNADNLIATLDKIKNPIDTMAKSADTASKIFEKTHKSGVDMGAGIANANKGAETALVKHADVVKKLGDVYNNLKSSTTTDLANMTSEFLSKMNDMSASIDKVKRSITDLQTAYSRQQQDDTANLADKIIASEQKIADFKTQIANETDAKKKADIQKQLDDEQKNFDSSKTFQTQNAGAITEAKRRAGLTQLQRDIEDFNTRRALAIQEFNDKMADLQRELQAQSDKQVQEWNLHQQKVAKITELEKSATDEFTRQSNIRLAQTTDEVNKSIALFQALASAMSAVRSSTSAGVSTVSVPIAGKRALGGNVAKGSTYLVGERGAELFTASQSGNITPNNAMGGGSNGGAPITINITGTFLSDDAGRKVGDMIVKRFKTMSRIGM
jgi:hypothetical protein